jgi:ribosomal protein S1
MAIKKLTEYPCRNLDDRFPLNQEVVGRVVNITDFGIFVEVLEGVEGLVHISEIDGSVPKNKINDFYPVDTELRVRVIKIDPEERRLGLSIIEVKNAHFTGEETNEEETNEEETNEEETNEEETNEEETNEEETA